MKKYIALIGELDPPGTAGKKESIPLLLGTEIKYLNDCMGEDLASLFIMTLRNGFMALWHQAGRIFEAIERIRSAAKPFGIRIGIGIGEITTGIDKDHNLRSDGPAWWEARKALESTRKFKRGICGSTDILIRGFDDDGIVGLVDRTLILHQTVRKRWTKGQAEMVGKIISINGFTADFSQKDLAITLGYDRPGLNKKLKSTYLCDYIQTANAIENILEKELNNRL